MSRKHYVAIARAIRSTRPEQYDGDWFRMTSALADVFAQDNPNFDRGRFMEAALGEVA